jgi:hypothetical protein
MALSYEQPAYEEAPRERVLAAALERRLRELDRLQRESDALRAEVAVRDGYVADLRRRLVDSEETLARTQRELARAQIAEAELTHEAYARYAAEETVVRRRIELAIIMVGRLRDRDRVAALRALRTLLDR